MHEKVEKYLQSMCDKYDIGMTITKVNVDIFKVSWYNSEIEISNTFRYDEELDILFIKNQYGFFVEDLSYKRNMNDTIADQ